MKCPSLGTSKTCVLSSSRLPCYPAIFLYPCSVLSNVLQSRCFEKVSLAICNLFSYFASIGTLKAGCLTADLIGSSFSLIYRTWFLQNRQNSPDGSCRSCITWAAWGKGSVWGSSGRGIQLFLLCREGQILTLGPDIGPHGPLGLSAGWQELGLLRLPAPTPPKRASVLSVRYDHRWLLGFAECL